MKVNWISKLLIKTRVQSKIQLTKLQNSNLTKMGLHYQAISHRQNLNSMIQSHLKMKHSIKTFLMPTPNNSLQPNYATLSNWFQGLSTPKIPNTKQRKKVSRRNKLLITFMFRMWRSALMESTSLIDFTLLSYATVQADRNMLMPFLWGDPMPTKLLDWLTT